MQYLQESYQITNRTARERCSIFYFDLVLGRSSAFRINPRLKNAVLREGDLCDRDGKHASRYNVETTITAARTKTGQSLQYERLLTKEGNTPGQKGIQHSMCEYEN